MTGILQHAPIEAPGMVDGRRFLVAIAIAVAVIALIGTASFC